MYNINIVRKIMDFIIQRFCYLLSFYIIHAHTFVRSLVLNYNAMSHSKYFDWRDLTLIYPGCAILGI